VHTWSIQRGSAADQSPQRQADETLTHRGGLCGGWHKRDAADDRQVKAAIRDAERLAAKMKAPAAGSAGHLLSLSRGEMENLAARCAPRLTPRDSGGRRRRKLQARRRVTPAISMRVGVACGRMATWALVWFSVQPAVLSFASDCVGEVMNPNPNAVTDSHGTAGSSCSMGCTSTADTRSATLYRYVLGLGDEP
jgi:hypothetical protein